MRLTCPACHAEMSLEAAVGREADARALAEFVARNVPLGALLTRYIALHRPPKRRLSLARTVALFGELQPDIERQAITRRGRDWPAPLALWRTAIEQVLAAADKGGLTLPLTGHGYLYEVLMGAADKAEAAAEREREAGLQARPAAAQAVPVAAALPHPGMAAPMPQPLPYDPSQGPSRAARAAQALMAAARARKQPQAADAAADPPTDDAGDRT